MMGLDPIQWARETENKRFKEHFRKLGYYQPQFNFIGWNCRRAIFSDKRVRRAMTMLVPRELILKKILFGLGAVVTAPFYINSPDYDKKIKPFPYDPQGRPGAS